MTIQGYYEDSAISQSLLKKLYDPKSVRLIVDGKWDNYDDQEEKDHFKIGKALDTLLTDYMNFDKLYVCVDALSVGGMTGKFIKKLPKGLNREACLSGKLTQNQIDLCTIAKTHSELKTDLFKLLIKVASVDKNWKFYEAVTGSDKIVLTKDEMDMVKHSKESLMNNPNCLDYFINNNANELIAHQIPIFFNWNEFDWSKKYAGEDVKGKSLLDGVRVNHTDKTIQPFDLKTAAKPWSFSGNYLTLGYYIQAAYYNLGMQSWMKRNEKYKDYKLLPMKFIVVGKKGKRPISLIYPVTEKQLEDAYTGFSTNSGRIYKGLYDYMGDYLWHLKSRRWEMARELYENNGERPIRY